MDSRNLKILYIDDDRDLLKIGKIFLDKISDFSVEIIDDPKRALTVIQSGSFDAVISDYEMPGLNGIQLLKKIRESGNNVPFIIFTGRGREEVVIQALNSGADFYLQKGGDPPSQFAELEHQIRHACQLRAANLRILNQERRLADIINFLPDATFAIDTDGLVIAWNRAMEELTGIVAEDMLGKGDYAYSIPLYQEKRPILIDIVLNEELLQKEKYPALLRDGNTLVAEASSPYIYQGRGGTFWFTATPLYDTNGTIVGAIESIRDITDRKKIEETLRINNERLVMAQEIGHNGNWELDVSTGLISASDESFRIFGIPKNETGLVTIEEIESKIPERERVHQALLDLITNDVEYNLEYSIITDGASFPKYIHSVARIKRDEQGNPEKIYGVLQDITPRKEIEIELRRKNDELIAANQRITESEDELISQLELLTQQKRQIQEDEERLRFLGENLHNGLVYQLVVHPDGKRYFSYISSGVTSIHGVTADEVLSDPSVLYNQLYEDDVERLKREEESSALKNSPFQIEVRCIPPDGRMKWLLLISVPRVTFDNDIIWDGLEIDITEQKRTEDELQKKHYELQVAYEEIIASDQELRENLDLLTRQEIIVRESEEHFQALFMHMVEGAALYDLIYDEQGIPINYIIKTINPAFEIHLGMSGEFVLGKTGTEVYGVETPPYLDVYAWVAETGKPETFETYFSPTNKFFLVSVYCPYKGSFATIFEDITERKRAEEALKIQYNSLISTEENLRQTKEFLESLIAIANVPIIVWDSSLRITEMNQAFEKLIGRQSDEVIGKSLEFLFSPDTQSQSMNYFQSTLDGVKLESVEMNILHYNGTIRTVIWNTSTLYSKDGITPLATIAQGRDITDERRLEQEKVSTLMQIQQNLAYLAILNDEIRNPLTIIITCADMIENNPMKELILIQIQRIDSIVSQLDQRWIESEKVLNVIRKHYHISLDVITRNNPHSEFQTYEFPESNIMVPLKGTIPASHPYFIQDQLYTILDSLDAIVYVADMDTHELLFMNNGAKKIFGDSIGKKCYTTLQNNPDGPCSFCTNQFLVKNNRPSGVYRWEFEHLKTGQWYDCRDIAIPWSDGRLVRLEIATEITRRKHAEDHLKDLTRMVSESEAKYRSLIEHNRDIIYTMNAEGVFTFVSPSWTVLLGHQIDEVIGKSFNRFIHPEDLDRCYEFMQQLIQGASHKPTIEYRVHHKDGSWRWFTTSVVCLKDSSGTVIGGEGSARDITDWKLAEHALQESEERYRKLVDNIPDYIVVHRYGVIEFVNASAAAVVGLQPEELIGAHLTDFLTDESREKVAVMMQKRVIDSNVAPYELTILTKGGIPKVTEVHGALIQYNGKPAFLNILTDVTEMKRTYDDLEKSEERLQTILKSLQVGIIIVDAKTHRILDANQKVLDLIRADLDDIAGVLCHTFICPAEVGKCPVTDLGQRVDSSERVIRTLDGEEIPVIKTVIQTKLGRNDVLIETFIDITDRKMMERALIESEAKYRQLIDYANDAIVVAQHGNIKLVNPRAREMSGYSEEELIDVPFSSFIAPTDQEMVADQHFRRLHGEDLSSRYSFRVIRKDGAIIWVEISSVVIDWEGSSATLNFISDITERKQMEMRLQDSYEMFSEYMYNSPIFTFIKEVTPTVSRVLQASENFDQMIGIKGKDMVGKTMEDLFPSDFARKITEDDWTVVTKGKILTLEETLNDRFYITIKFPIIQKDHTFLAGYTIDITDRKKAEAALLESNKKLRLLTGLTRHDIFNQLSAAHLYTDMAIDSPESSKVHDFLFHANEALNRIETIIGFTREYEDFGVVSSGWHLIYSVIQAALKEVSLNEIQVTNDVSMGLEVYADPIIRKVFTTLFENSVRHGGKISEITLSSREVSGSVIISYHDDGIGIPDQEKEHIFVHGYGKHTGIGLFLSKEILSITGLSIRECGIFGEGVTFEILIPSGRFRYVQPDI